MVDDFDDWYGRVRPRLAAALTGWCGDASLAAEALDEAFVRYLEQGDRAAAIAQPDGWVWRTATNVVRRRQRRRTLEDRLLRRHADGKRGAADGPTADDVDLQRALLALTERQRTAVTLHHLADLPIRAVAEAMEVAEGTVSATLHQARRRLATLLALDPEPDDTAAAAASADRSALANRPDGAVP